MSNSSESGSDQNSNQSHSLVEKLTRLAEQTCEREGCRLYDLEWVSGSKGKGRVVRVFVDRMDKEVSLEDCENVSRALSLLLEVEDLIPGGEYDLEVSTPGLERRLTKPWHFQAAIGKTVQIRTNEDMMSFNPEWPNQAKRQNAKGEILEVNEEGFVLAVDQMKLKIPFHTLVRAQIVFDFEKDKGKKKK